MLKSIVFLLVLISFITAPTQAYEAYSIYSPDFKNMPEVRSITGKKMPENYELCETAVIGAEEKYHIQANLLQTIASVESGRWDEKAGRRIAWPWTVHANGEGRYYKTRREAVAAVRALQQQGVTNIDVGCMQINLKYHGQAFSSLEEAFEPEKNVAYSAQFLRRLYQKNSGNWVKTAMQYHSRNNRKGLNYKKRLEKHYAEFVRTDSGAKVLFLPEG